MQAWDKQLKDVHYDYITPLQPPSLIKVLVKGVESLGTINFFHFYRVNHVPYALSHGQIQATIESHLSSVGTSLDSSKLHVHQASILNNNVIHFPSHSCIEKWIKGGGGGKCPQCNAPAKKGDIRVIYSKAISVVDTTDRDRALKDLEEEKRLRIAAQKAEAQAVIQYQLARAECDRLKEEIRQLRVQLESYDGGLPPPGEGMTREKLVSSSDVYSDREGQYVLSKTIKISDVSCPVLLITTLI